MHQTVFRCVVVYQLHQSNVRYKETCKFDLYVYACNGSTSQNSKYGEVEIGAAVATALAAYKGFQDGTGFFGTMNL